ncbi:MAG: AAA-like domain-containing protein [Capsulimonadales bacterium]|nr:AAA-like domain-containing protein [Capsulimonadales bacterium]
MSAHDRTFFRIGGTLPTDAPSYLVRDSDEKLLHGLLDGEYCYLLNTRQMGKSSLCVRVRQELEARNVRTVYLELSAIGGVNATSAAWYATLLSRIGRELGLHAEFTQHRRERAEQTPVSWLFSALEEIALARIDGPIVLILDEIDSVLNLSFSRDEFFGALRSLYNRRVSQPALRHLTFCLVGSAAPADLVSDTRLSPFNIGRLIDLRDFTRQEIAPLGEGLNRAGRAGDAWLDRVYYWTGGHPFLTQSLCARIAEDTSLRTVRMVDALVEEMYFERAARRGNVHLADVANRMLTRKTGSIDPADDAQKAAILALYERLLKERSQVPDDETNPLVVLLKLSGIVRVDQGSLRVRNRIYRRVFDREWIDENRPDAEKRRLRSAYRAGLKRAALGLSALVLLFGALAFFAFQQRAEALKAKNIAEQQKAIAQNQKSEADRQRLIAQEERDNARRQTEIAEGQKRVAETQKRMAERQRRQAEEASQRANKAAREARRQEQVASSARISEARQRRRAEQSQQVAEWEVITRDVNTAMAAVHSGDYLASLPFFADAWNREKDPKRRRVYGTQITEALNRSPRLLQATPVDRYTPFVAFSRDGGLISSAGDSDRSPAFKLRFPTPDPDGFTLARLAERNDDRNDLPRVAAFTADRDRLLTVRTTRGGRFQAQILDIIGEHVRTVGPPFFVPLPPGMEPDGYRLSDRGRRIVLRLISSDKRELNKFLVFDTEERRIVFEQSLPDTRIMAEISRDGQLLAVRLPSRTYNQDSLCLYRLDPPDGRSASSPDPFARLPVWGGIHSVALDRAARRAVLATEYGTVLLPLPSPGAEEQVRFPRDPDGKHLLDTKYTTLACFAPGEELLLAANMNGLVFTYALSSNSAEARFITAFHAHGAQLVSLVMARDNDRLLTASKDNTAALWNPRTGQRIASPLRIAASPKTADLSPDGRFALTVDDGNRVRLWDTAPSSARQLTTMWHDMFVRQTVFSPDSHFIALIKSEGGMLLTDARTGIAQTAWLSARPFNASNLYPLNHISFSPDSRLVAVLDRYRSERDVTVIGSPLSEPLRTGSESRSEGVAIYEVPSGRLIGRFLLPGGENIRRCRFADHRTLYLAGDKGTLVPVDPRARRPLNTPLRLPAGIVDLDISPNGQYLALLSQDRRMELRDLRRRSLNDSGSLVRSQENTSGSCLRFSPDGRHLLSFGAIGNDHDAPQDAVLYRVADGQEWRRLPHEHTPVEAHFSPDGQRLLTRFNEADTVYLWDLQTGRWSIPPIRDSDSTAILSIAYSPDGQFVATGNKDGVVRFWDADSGMLMGLRKDARVLSLLRTDDPRKRINSCVTLAISPDGRSVASGGWLGVVCWDTPISSLTLSQAQDLSAVLATTHVLPFNRDRKERDMKLPTPAETDSAWARLKRASLTYRTNPVTAPTRVLQLRAKVCLARGDWAGAVGHLTQLLNSTEADPADPIDRWALEHRAYALIRQGAAAGALEDLNRTAFLLGGSGNTYLLAERGVLLLELGDVRGYRFLCDRATQLVTEWLGASPQTPAENIREAAVSTLRLASLTPSVSRETREHAAELAFYLMGDGSAPELSVVLAWRYREGRYAEASALYERLRASRAWDSLSDWERAWCATFGGMAAARLKNPESARERLLQAGQYAPNRPPAPSDWPNRRMILVLRREASGHPERATAVRPTGTR